MATDSAQGRPEGRPQTVSTTRIVPPVPCKGQLRARWWNELYDALAGDADYQRAELLRYSPDDPSAAAGWFEGCYRARLHELLDHAVDRTEWTP